jgi:hypothetical protein
MTYRLSRHAREHYDQRILTDPPVAAWEASFNGGTTWVAGTVLVDDPETGWVRWLIAGDLADPGASVAQLAPTGREDLQPLARSVANPEIIVRDLEPIRVE